MSLLKKCYQNNCYASSGIHLCIVVDFSSFSFNVSMMERAVWGILLMSSLITLSKLKLLLPLSTGEPVNITLTAERMLQMVSDRVSFTCHYVSIRVIISKSYYLCSITKFKQSCYDIISKIKILNIYI